MAQLIKPYMVKKQSTWYLWQVSLMAASAWPSPRGLHVSHSPASPNWNRTIATTEYMQREEKEEACMRERKLWQHTSSTPLESLQSIPGIVDWLKTGCSYRVTVWQPTYRVFHTALFICTKGTADHQSQGLSEGSLYQSKPQCWAFLLVVAGDWALMLTVTVHQSKAAGDNNLSSTLWFMDVIRLVWHQLH